MKASRYLIIAGKKGFHGWECQQVRITTGKPKLKSNEHAIKIMFDLPDALFERPQLEASIVIPVDSVTKPTIEAETIDTIQEAIESQTGIDLKIQLVEPEEQE